jgi:phosphoribosyl-ATP pyrophosphohydrolase/phosphoribosyl-AMP cyclohydrolase
MSLSLDALTWNEQGLLPAIAQDRLTGEVRMMAWMNRAALEATLETRQATFFSRSRGALWVKGESSGNVLFVESVLADCDGDTLLLLCEPAGPSCHTGAENCFFQSLEGDPRPAQPGPARVFSQRLEAVIDERKQASAEKSYTRSLLEGGPEKIGKKIVEEAHEVVQAIGGESDERVASEAADVLFHLLVGLRSRGVALRDVLAVLAKRFGTGGHVEKASRHQH